VLPASRLPSPSPPKLERRLLGAAVPYGGPHFFERTRSSTNSEHEVYSALTDVETMDIRTTMAAKDIARTGACLVRTCSDSLKATSRMWIKVKQPKAPAQPALWMGLSDPLSGIRHNVCLLIIMGIISELVSLSPGGGIAGATKIAFLGGA
jgi:hypothetical protein